MPLLFEKNIEDHSKLAVWHTTEPISYFVHALNLKSEEQSALEEMKPRRQKEWLSSRYLVHLLTKHPERIPVDKDFCGKPNLKGRHEHISISHSRDHVAVAYSDRCVGIDIQHEEDKICRIKNKFISKSEMLNLDTNHSMASYHIFWGAKECMYKAYGKKELDFRKHMHLYPFRYYQANLELRGWVRKGEIDQAYEIITEKLGEYYLVFSYHI